MKKVLKKVLLYLCYTFCISLIILWSFLSYYTSEFPALYPLNGMERIKEYILSGWYILDVVPIFITFLLIKFIKKKLRKR